jgi:hypothetical protein
MSPRTVIEALRQLQDEIATLRSTMLYLERRILEKQRAMVEIAASGDWAPTDEPGTVPLATERIRKKRRLFTLTDACREVISQMNGDVLAKRDFKRRIRAAHPELGKGNIATNVRNSLEVLVRAGEVVEVDGGYTRVNHKEV